VNIDISDLVENPTPRTPIALVLDTSGSMEGEPIKELNEGVKVFIDEIRNDEYARYSAEICIVTFGKVVTLVQDFATVDRIPYPSFKAGGSTPMGAAVLEATNRLENRKSYYKEFGIDYHRPWMVLMTDGKPTDSIDEAVRRTQEMILNKKLEVFPIAVGSEADMNTLEKFANPKRRPLKLKGLCFKEFFAWLSKSVAQISKSSPGDRVKLDLEGIKGWAELE